MNIYMSLSYLWTLCLFEKMRLSIVATVVGAWHFHPEDKPSILVGIKNMATSFGTLSASALISSIAEYLNRLLNENTWASWIPPTLFVTAPLKILLCCCGTCVQSLVQMLTKFAVILHVFTGEAFVGSGKHVFKILKRHFKSGFVTEYTSKSLLTLASYAFSIGVAMVSWKWIDDEFDCGTLNKGSSADGSYFILYILVMFFTTWYPVLGIYVLIVVSKFLQDAGREGIEGGGEGWNHVWIPPLAATFVGCISMLLFRFLSSLFLDIIDTLFLCFAIDKDNKIERRNDEFTELVKQMPDYTEVGSVDSNQESA